MDAEELIKRYLAGERDFRGIHINLDRLGCLEGADLPGIILSHAMLYTSFSHYKSRASQYITFIDSQFYPDYLDEAKTIYD